MNDHALDPASVCALVPCHREAPGGDLVARLLDAVGSLVIADDGVPGAEKAAVADLARRPRVETTSTNGSRGKGYAIAAGIERVLAQGSPPEAILVVDSDGQHPPEAVPAFLAAGGRADLVVGDRFAELSRMPLERRLANAAAHRLLAAATGVAVRDTQCGMRLLRGPALHEVRFDGGRYEAEARHLRRCLRAGLRVLWVEIPAIYEGAPSSFRPIRDTMRVAKALVV